MAECRLVSLLAGYDGNKSAATAVDSLVQAYKTIILGLSCDSHGAASLSSSQSSNDALRHQIKVMVNGLNNSNDVGDDEGKTRHLDQRMPLLSLDSSSRSSIISCYRGGNQFIKRWQQQWERRVCKSLNNMSAELEISLSIVRSPIERKSVFRRWEELSSIYCSGAGLDLIRPVFSAKDFYDTVTHMKNPNRRARQTVEILDSELPLSLYVPPIRQIKELFTDLSVKNDFISPDQWLLLGEHLVNSPCSQKLLCEYVKIGCPHGLRRHMWLRILGLTDISTSADNHVYELKQLVLMYDMLVDKLIVKDVKLTAANDPQYFVFEEKLYQILLMFMRDTSVLTSIDTASIKPLKGSSSIRASSLGVPGSPYNSQCVIYPPCGVIPFHGFSMILAPLCFVYADNTTLYHCFREIYTRYFHHLHYMSAKPSGILHLCCVFESLLKSRDMPLYYHLRECDCQPVRLAFRWLLRAFAGYLASDQVLYLWDRVLAENSTLVLAVLAAGIFVKNRKELLNVPSQISLDAALSDVTNTNVFETIRNFFTE